MGKDVGHHVKKELRVILLGIGGSGKTTFSKQMQIIHQGNFDEERAKSYTSILLTNILLGLKAIATEVKDLEDTENYKISRWVQTLDENQAQWNEELIGKVKALWGDPGILKTWKDIKDGVIIQLDYLMDNLDRFVSPGFIPTNDDILRARQRTTGELLSTFEDQKYQWNLIDVGGQFAERVKWAKIFESPTPQAIIFFLAIDEYNVPNTELKTEHYKTKLELALSVFKDYLCDAGPVLEKKLCRIVFLNKVDVFSEKIQNPAKFAEFKRALGYEGEESAEKCAAAVRERMAAIAAESKLAKGEHNEVYFHVTNALDTSLMTKVTQEIKKSIITSTMQDLGLA